MAEDLSEAFLKAIRDGDASAASQLDQQPGLSRSSIFAAAAAGDGDAVADFLGRDPSLVHATHGREEWTPLAYACRSELHATNTTRARGLERVALLVLDAGASPNSGSQWWESEHKKVPISALYHACMSNHLALVDALLERGAATQDGESIYHAAQLDRRECLERLLTHGADLSSRQSPYGNTPLYFLVGHETDEDGHARWFHGLTWLLEHGADPNVTSYTSAETPLHAVAARPHKLATARALLTHGADVNLPRADGRTAYQVAVRSGNTGMAALLLLHGANSSLRPEDEFLGACLAGDREAAQALLAHHADLRSGLPDADQVAVVYAVHQDNAAAVRLMADLGFDLGREAEHGGTPLHWAAWTGKVDLVQLLIDLGAPIDVRDRQYGASPLGWAAHGSEHHHHDDERYCAIVDKLADAGARREFTINKWSQPLQGTPRVAERLKARGLA